jgi:hypothetical protein
MVTILTGDLSYFPIERQYDTLKRNTPVVQLCWSRTVRGTLLTLALTLRESLTSLL